MQVEDRWLVLQGIPARSAATFDASIRAVARAAGLRESFDTDVQEVQVWVADLQAAARAHLAAKGWLTREFQFQWVSAKPGARLGALLKEPALAQHVEAQDGSVLDAIDVWADPAGYIRVWNEKHLASELVVCRDFFDRVERSPLTEEQARAVICFENRVQVIASAGSGKTSTMVAKAAYALHRNLVPAEKILLLAFNKDAAKELEARIRDRLRPLGLAGNAITAQTFHAFGLGVIGKATGRKPSLAPWLEGGQAVAHMLRIVDELKDANPAFRMRWEFFRIVLFRDLPGPGKEEEGPTDWDAQSRTSSFRTLQGELVKSHGERMIADWLFFNGVTYEYEPKYEIDTVDAEHRQYTPDFYYPDIDVYHEHFALDSHGRAPATFEGYIEGVQWKRETHQQYETTLLETTMAGVKDGTAFSYLEKELTDRGIILAPDPDRVVKGPTPIDDERLIRTFRTFLIHVKNNQLTEAELQERLHDQDTQSFQFRHAMFLSLFGEIWAKWEEHLTAGEYIDYEDMLNRAVEHLETGSWNGGYDLVMVDEMQDASYGRARLAKALVDKPGKYLFAVGDDWQSINRFAGADLSVMTRFEQWFGPGETLRLEKTFRSPQSICDVSSAFIQQNPAQLSKRVVSSTPDSPRSISAISVSEPDQYAGIIGRYLEELNRAVQDGTVVPTNGTKVQVRVLGRYRKQLKHMPAEFAQSNRSRGRWEYLDVQYDTIHSSKGMEADYIIILGLTKGRDAFPSEIVDDPVLQLAMPHGDSFPMAEERRLFYVALTRAKRQVLLLTVQNKESSFLLELVRDHGLTLRDADGKATASVICPGCGKGFMVQRQSVHGLFYGCSEYPKCKHKMQQAAMKRALYHR